MKNKPTKKVKSTDNRERSQEDGVPAAAVQQDEADDSRLLPGQPQATGPEFPGKSVSQQLAAPLLITGASRGIGRAIATQFAAAGDRVAIHHKASPALAQELAAELDGTGHVVVQADLADSDAVLAMVDSAVEQLGGLDILVNNAGVFTSHPITEVSYEVWQRELADDPGDQPDRRGQRHLVRGQAHEGTRRPHHQRLIARRLPRRA